MPLAVWLLGIVAAVAVPLVSLIGISAWGLYRAQEAQFQAQLMAEARGGARQVEQEFAALKAFGTSLANSPALAHGDTTAFAAELRAAQAMLAARSGGERARVDVRWLDRNVVQHADATSAGAVGDAVAIARQAMAAGTSQIVLRSGGEGTKLPSAAVAVPVFAPERQQATGAIVITVPQGWLLARAASAIDPAGTAILLLDRNGRPIMGSPNQTASPDTLVPAALLQDIGKVPSGSLPVARNALGLQHIVAFAHAPGSGLVVLLDAPAHSLLAPLRDALIPAAPITALVVLFCVLLAVWLGNRMAHALRRVPDIAAEQAEDTVPRSTGLREADTLSAVLSGTLARRAYVEARLNESEERLRLATEAAEIGLWDVDPIADRLYWPPVVKAMFGISPDVPVTMADFYAGLHPDDRDRVIAAYKAALDPAHRAVYDVVYRTVGKEDGVIRWVAAKGRGIFDQTGQCVRVIGTCIDTTVRRATARQLRELSETLEQRVAQAIQERDRVWRNSRDILAVVDTRGLLRTVNPAATAVLGFNPSEVVGRSFLQFVWPGDVALAQRGFETVKTGGNLTSFQVRFRHKDGAARWLSWHATREGNLVYAYGRDITAEKAAAAELAMAQETLHQTQKIETIGQLTGGVAHDFNNLLTPIVGALDLLMLRSEGDSRAERIANAALQAADKARTLIQRLLAFSRRQHLEARAVDVRALIDSLVELASRSLGPQIRLTLDIEDDLPPAWVDPNQLELALLNLAVNARDAMSGVGTLVISAKAETTTLPGKLLPGRYVRITVSDTGCGMDADTLKRAVEPFFTTKTTGRGTGLGLSMVHGLAAQSGGDFMLDSTPGVGTRATLRLPVSRVAMPGARTEVPQAAISAGVRRTTILLVDDEDLVRTGVAEMLCDAGFTVAQAESGLEALSMIQAGLRPNVLVTDFAMPGMNGVELARALQHQLPGLPVLLITGYAKLDTQDADDLPRLAKPFRQRDIVAVLTGLLNEASVAA